MATETKLKIVKFKKQVADNHAGALLKRDWHQTILVFFMLFSVGASLISPSLRMEFWYQEQLLLEAIRFALGGLSPLLVVVFAYILHRQFLLYKTRQQLAEATAQSTVAERRAQTLAFSMLPGMVQFRDSLAMEHRRAEDAGARLCVVLFSVDASHQGEVGQIAGMVNQMLRPGETVARISDTSIGVILPAMDGDGGAAFAARIEDNVQTFMPQVEIFSSITSYPDEAVFVPGTEAPAQSVSRNSGLTLIRPRAAVAQA